MQAAKSEIEKQMSVMQISHFMVCLFFSTIPHVWAGAASDTNMFMVKLEDYIAVIDEQTHLIESVKNTNQEQAEVIAEYKSTIEALNRTTDEQTISENKVSTEALNKTIQEQWKTLTDYINTTEALKKVIQEQGQVSLENKNATNLLNTTINDLEKAMDEQKTNTESLNKTFAEQQEKFIQIEDDIQTLNKSEGECVCFQWDLLLASDCNSYRPDIFVLCGSLGWFTAVCGFVVSKTRDVHVQSNKEMPCSTGFFGFHAVTSVGDQIIEVGNPVQFDNVLIDYGNGWVHKWWTCMSSPMMEMGELTSDGDGWVDQWWRWVSWPMMEKGKLTIDRDGRVGLMQIGELTKHGKGWVDQRWKMGGELTNDEDGCVDQWGDGWVDQWYRNNNDVFSDHGVWSFKTITKVLFCHVTLACLSVETSSDVHWFVSSKYWHHFGIPDTTHWQECSQFPLMELGCTTSPHTSWWMIRSMPTLVSLWMVRWSAGHMETPTMHHMLVTLHRLPAVVWLSWRKVNMCVCVCVVSEWELGWKCDYKRVIERVSAAAGGTEHATSS